MARCRTYLYLANPNGIAVTPGGSIASTTGLTVDTLGVADLEGEVLVNEGVIEGGAYLRLHSARINGGGAFRTNNAHVSTFGNANNPVHGAYYLSNGLQFYPSSGTTGRAHAQRLRHRAAVPQPQINGNARS